MARLKIYNSATSTWDYVSAPDQSTVTTTGTQTLTNKTIVAGNNTISGIANANLSTTAGGIGGAWKTWTHSFAGFTNGSETVTAKYSQIGKTIHVRLKAVLGATPSAVTNFTFNLPVTSSADYTEFTAINGSAAMKDANGGHFIANCYHVNTTSMIIRRLDPTTLATATPSTTTPFTWVSGDSVHVSFTYEAA